MSVCRGESFDVQGNVVVWVCAGDKHQIKNTDAMTLKVATTFIPAYTAESISERCLEAARAASKS